MAPSLYDQFLFVVNSGDEELAKDFLVKNKDKFSPSAKIAIESAWPQQAKTLA